MCEYLPVYHKPTGCVAFPKHVVEVIVYLACLEIINDPTGAKERCDDKDCHLAGSLGSTRTRAECPHCLCPPWAVIEPLYIMIRDQEFASLIAQSVAWLTSYRLLVIPSAGLRLGGEMQNDNNGRLNLIDRGL
ncbi:hypothetical protein KXX21_000132 [Aspergillus fumigatus]|nr:hypothetical protein KXX21_000132 [Aspergillus fumigatus]